MSDSPKSEEYESGYTHESISAIHDYGVDIWHSAGPELWLVSASDAGDSPGEEAGVDHTITTRTLKNIAICENQFEAGGVGLVRLKINGGDWTQGMAVHNAFRCSSLHWVFLNYGEARSMSSLIFLAGRRRVMMPDSKFMFHTGTLSGVFTGTQLDTEYAEFQKDQERMLDIYCEAMNRPGTVMVDSSEFTKRAWLLEQMKSHEEVYMSAGDAVAYGFAHSVFDGDWSTIREFGAE